MARRLLVAMGDATDQRTWSGTPYHLLQAGLQSGFLQGGLALRPEVFRSGRLLWNARALITTLRFGGYQYSEPFLEALFRRGGAAPDDELVSHFPLLPPASWKGRFSFYIDATLKQNFEDYGLGRWMSREVMEDAVRRERERYHRATHVVCMTRWTAESVRRDYGVNPEKVHWVKVGANLDEEALRALPPTEAPARNVLRLGFVGKDWQRKGLPRLLRVAERIEAMGQRVQVVVVGPEPASLPAHPLLAPAGFIDKRCNLAEFVRVVRGTHFGCLLSTAEAAGVSTFEFLRLGIPVVGANVGGIPDAITLADGLLVDATASSEQVATAVLEVWRPERYHALRDGAHRRADDVTWASAVQNLERVWGAP